MQAARTLFDAAAPLLAKRGATKEQRREDFMHLRTHWLETAAIAPFTSFYLPPSTTIYLSDTEYLGRFLELYVKMCVSP